MELSYKELAVLNQMISIAMLSGKIEFNEIVESIHKKITNEIADRAEKEVVYGGKDKKWKNNIFTHV